MEFLNLLEKLRTPWLDTLMLAVTQLGDEIAFLAVALTVFWCVDKTRGYLLMSVGFVGTVTSQFMKLACRIPRPWVRDPGFTILEAAREGAGGYSFPSGHSQSAVGTFGSMARTEKNKWIRRICVALMILVPFSRMYIGVHTPADVLVGAGISLVLVFALHPVVYRVDGKGMPWLIAAMAALALGYLLYVELWQFPADIDAHNLASARENAYTLFGCTLGMTIVYPVERRAVNFPTGAVWWAQILKVALGLAAVLLVKEGAQVLLEAVMGPLPARAARYFLVVLTAGLLWPMTFRSFSKLGRK